MNIGKRKIIFSILIIILINCLLNYNFFITNFNNNKEMVYDLSGNNDRNYEINNIDSDVKVIYIRFDSTPNDLTIDYKNAELQKYKHFNSSYKRKLVIEDEVYVYTSLSSNITDLKFTINDGKINKIILNPKVKYKLNILNTFLISVIVFASIYVISGNNKLNFNDCVQRNKTIVVLLILVVLLITFCSYHYKREVNILYYLYTDAVINKRLDLNFPVDEKLLNNSNPYDPCEREYYYLWDASYYNGKYYCYFGIWPVLTLLAPVKILTGQYISLTYLSFLYSIGSIIAMYLLYKEIIKKYFNNIKYNTFILSFLYIVFGSKLFWCMHRSNFYELASVSAYFHILIGLYLVLFNKNENTKRDFLGYSFLATAVLCRPTSLLLSLLIIPNIISKIKNKKFKLKNAISLIIPYLVVGIFAMYLNYVRFGNVLEFGVSYQLTTTNFYNNKYSFLRAFIGVFYYFFAVYKIKLLPFTVIGIIDNYPLLSDVYIEDIGGGIISTSIIGIVIFFFPWIINKIKDKKLKIYLILSLIIGLILCMISSGNIGFTGRYMLDFNYLFYFIIVVLSLVLLKKDKSSVLEKVFIIGLIISIIVNYCLSLTNII